jgi:hypothetical protein
MSFELYGKLLVAGFVGILALCLIVGLAVLFVAGLFILFR